MEPGVAAAGQVLPGLCRCGVLEAFRRWDRQDLGWLDAEADLEGESRVTCGLADGQGGTHTPREGAWSEWA